LRLETIPQARGLALWRRGSRGSLAGRIRAMAQRHWCRLLLAVTGPRGQSWEAAPEVVPSLR